MKNSTNNKSSKYKRNDRSNKCNKNNRRKKLQRQNRSTTEVVSVSLWGGGAVPSPLHLFLFCCCVFSFWPFSVSLRWCTGNAVKEMVNKLRFHIASNILQPKGRCRLLIFLNENIANTTQTLLLCFSMCLALMFSFINFLGLQTCYGFLTYFMALCVFTCSPHPYPLKHEI